MGNIRTYFILFFLFLPRISFVNFQAYASSLTLGYTTKKVAGGGMGNTGKAIDGRIGIPEEICLDSKNILYIADKPNHCIRKIDSTGVITLVAGNGRQGFSGDGGKAAEAMLNTPSGITIDADNLYIADESNHRIRKIDKNGIITTIAGNGHRGFAGDGGKATEAELNFPSCVAVYSGNIYIGDTVNLRIRKINPKGIITTIAGGGDSVVTVGGVDALKAKLPYIYNLIASSDGIYISSGDCNCVQKINSDGIIATIAGNGEADLSGDGGKAVKSRLKYPKGIVYSNKNLYIADNGNMRIRKIDVDGIINTVFKNENSKLSKHPYSIAINSAYIYIGYMENGIIRVSKNGKVHKMAAGKSHFAGDGLKASESVFYYPHNVTTDNKNNIYISDSGNQRIRKINTDGVITTIAGNGKRGFEKNAEKALKTSLNYPHCVAVDEKQNIYIADSWNNVIRVVSSEGEIKTLAGNGKNGFSGDGGTALEASLNKPCGVDVDSGKIFIADTGNNRIRMVNSQGIIRTIAGNSRTKLKHPHSVKAVSGKIFIADTDNHRILMLDALGFITTVAGNGIQGFSGDGGKATAASLSWPYDISVDGTNIYISDSGNNCIRKVNKEGIITTISDGMFEGKKLDYPHGIALGLSGELYITEWGNHNLWVIYTAQDQPKKL